MMPQEVTPQRFKAVDGFVLCPVIAQSDDRSQRESHKSLVSLHSPFCHERVQAD